MLYNWIRVTRDTPLSNSPGYLAAVIVTPDGDSDKTKITLYDGESTDDPEILTIRSGTGITKNIVFNRPLKFHRGLYAEVGGHFEEALIQLTWEKE